ncbi:hypothetical protein SAMN05660479_00930 [Microbulbifer thermotolerans]|uniref:hypothetical protein n=1 Tax=Microbulbifer thermotolerans TaxID=252514 RepID=UPI0008ED94B4|nr:hypothetical protein [Microbulbifer thermotolerans]SFB94890.1 hypothetical protein SAMN05660479_00930 [Microbulbifer thermotolerans]
MKKTEIERRLTRGQQSAAVELAQLIERAKTAQPRNIRQTGPASFKIDHRRSGLAGQTGWLDMRSLLPELLDAEGVLTKTPAATPAGETRTLEASILANSRACQAGAHLLVVEPAMEPIEGAGAFRMQRAGFRVISPATVDALTLDANGEGTATAQALPIAEAEIDPDAWTQRACRFEISRAEMRDNPQVVDELLIAIGAGLSHAADQELLTAISAAAPDAFSLAAAAAAGCRFSDLRALTDGTGATVADDGQLRLAGVPAELSQDLPGSLIGDFGTAALAIKPEITVLAERTDAQGGLALTVWAGMQALLPTASKFWSVS